MSAPTTKKFGKSTREVPHHSQKAQKWYPADDETKPKTVSCTRLHGDEKEEDCEEEEVEDQLPVPPNDHPVQRLLSIFPGILGRLAREQYLEAVADRGRFYAAGDGQGTDSAAPELGFKFTMRIPVRLQAQSAREYRSQLLHGSGHGRAGNGQQWLSMTL
jgi:hypothetical protein